MVYKRVPSAMIAKDPMEGLPVFDMDGEMVLILATSNELLECFALASV